MCLRRLAFDDLVLELAWATQPAPARLQRLFVARVTLLCQLGQSLSAAARNPGAAVQVSALKMQLMVEPRLCGDWLGRRCARGLTHAREQSWS